MSKPTQGLGLYRNGKLLSSVLSKPWRIQEPGFVVCCLFLNIRCMHGERIKHLLWGMGVITDVHVSQEIHDPCMDRSCCMCLNANIRHILFTGITLLALNLSSPDLTIKRNNIELSHSCSTYVKCDASKALCVRMFSSAHWSVCLWRVSFLQN